jgi:hypothetical protein
MRFTIDQRFSAPPEQVAKAFADPALYAGYPDGGTLARPEVVACSADGTIVEMQLRHRFNGDISPAARAILDPGRLTWVEHTTHRLDGFTGSFVLRPDHYADRLRCSGSIRYEADGTGSRRRGEGELHVRAPLVAGAVERAIISGLQDHLRAEVEVVEAYLRDR